MVRPRWHDALIVCAIVGLLGLGGWALWWDDVRSFLHLGPAPESSEQGPVKANPADLSSPRT